MDFGVHPRFLTSKRGIIAYQRDRLSTQRYASSVNAKATIVSIIFRDFDQNELDAQYNNRAHVPDYENYYDGWKPACAEILINLKSSGSLLWQSSTRAN